MLTSDEVFDHIEEIAKASGNSKQVLLRATDHEITRYLVAAYNPYRRYYNTSTVKGHGQEQFSDITWIILDQLHERTLSGDSANFVVDTHIRDLTPKSAELFKRILKKDLRMGMGAKTINKVFPGLIPVHKVMLAKLFDKKRVKYPCFGSPKIDGVRAIFKNGKFYSRGGHIYQGLDLLATEIMNNIGFSTPLDGELTVANKSFQEGSGMIRSNSSTPDAIFHVFDLPEVDIPFVERLTLLADIQVPSFKVYPVMHKKLYSFDEITDFYTTCRKTNYEGAVIKSYSYKYKGTRSYDWMKMKNVDTADLEIVGVFEGTGKYEGQLGGIIVDFNGVEVRVGSGFSDSDRVSFWDNQDVIIGQIAEVLYMEVTPDGSLRHPRFIRFRTF